VLVLEVVDDLFERRVALELESVPESPIDVAVLGEEGEPKYAKVVSCKNGEESMEIESRQTFCLAAWIGSEKPKKGRARLTKPFL
jgi:hypothetical protein